MPTNETRPTTEIERHPNRLIHEKSPYLLQHAYNPVDWYPWGEEAFQKAREENKLIFLSIGYSTCHWCHVMEDESFEDEEVAALMNEAFVSIKVDREERPDIDSIYMTVAVMMTQSGGWPLNIIMTPDQKPVLAMTYIPKTTRFQRTGMLELIPRIQDLWRDDPQKVLDSAEQVTTSLQNYSAISAGEALEDSLLGSAYQGLSNQYDPVHGGFGSAPKFPTPHNLLYLLHYWLRSGDEDALIMVEATLRAMRFGGIYDQLGYGFHRYSTDAEWFAPHFEKMLYDQAMLGMAYSDVFLATGKPEFEQTAREIYTYVLRDMLDTKGGFNSAEDADSEGIEGKYYLWTTDEIRILLPEDEASFVIDKFNLSESGNFTEGKPEGNILHLSQALGEGAERWEPIQRKLYEEREKRIKPYKDDKVLTDWNGLMIASLSKAAQAFNEPEYAQAAQAAADFILSEMRDEGGRLLHRYRGGEVGINGTIDDYAFFIWGLLELYETTFDVRYLTGAIELQSQLDAHFWDDTSGGYFQTADDGEELLTRIKKIDDSAIPSGNSIAMLNLLRLGRITADTEYEERADQLSRAFSSMVTRFPHAYPQLLSGFNFALGPSFEVVIVGDPDGEDTQAMLAALREDFNPNKVVLLRDKGDDPTIAEFAEFTKSMFSLNGRATAFVCTNYYCQKPTTDVEVMKGLLRGAQGTGE